MNADLWNAIISDLPKPLSRGQVGEDFKRLIDSSSALQASALSGRWGWSVEACTVFAGSLRLLRQGDNLTGVKTVEVKQAKAQSASEASKGWSTFLEMRSKLQGIKSELSWATWSKHWIRAVDDAGSERRLLLAWRFLLTSEDTKWWRDNVGSGLAGKFLTVAKHRQQWLIASDGYEYTPEVTEATQTPTELWEAAHGRPTQAQFDSWDKAFGRITSQQELQDMAQDLDMHPEAVNHFVGKYNHE